MQQCCERPDVASVRDISTGDCTECGESGGLDPSGVGINKMLYLQLLTPNWLLIQCSAVQ